MPFNGTEFSPPFSGAPGDEDTARLCDYTCRWTVGAAGEKGAFGIVALFDISISFRFPLLES